MGAGSPSEADKMHHVWSLQEVEDHMRCLCPPGVGGALCQFAGERCGSDGMCLHGGTCVTTTHPNGSGISVTQHHCDCTTATDGRGASYAGKYCEHKATALCSEDDWNLFCTQGGTCKSNPVEGCSCPRGTAGYKCEFIIDNLDNGSTQDDGPGAGGDDDDQDDEDVEVVQPPGAVLCASGPNGAEGLCQNGGVCFVEDIIGQGGTRTTKEVCDCSGAHTDRDIFAGPFCQYKSTSLCLIGDEGLPASLQGFDRFCVNNGQCQTDGSCVCRSGWVGDNCEQQLQEINDPTDGDAADGNGDGIHSGPVCGGTRCYNGGTCVATEVLHSNGEKEVLTHCDCSTAFDENHLYAGESCQFSSTQLCTVMGDSESLRGTIFCTNHGICNDNVHLGCDCPDGFTGFACEYERHGDSEEDDNDDGDGPDDNWEICGGDGLVCHNGGRCVTTITEDKDTGATQTEYKCDCATAYNEEKAYLGLSCEYPSTTICEPELDGEPLSAAFFCVNSGTCKNNPFDGCNCPVGFTGNSCQFKADVVDIINADTDGDNIELERCGDHLVCLNVRIVLLM